MSKDQKAFTSLIDLGWASRTLIGYDLIHGFVPSNRAHNFVVPITTTSLLDKSDETATTMESSPLIILYTTKENVEESGKLRSLMKKTGLTYEEHVVDQGTINAAQGVVSHQT
jgi:hypothetical protein